MVACRNRFYDVLGDRQSSNLLISSTDNLVLSPVVIAMWKPMAEALGWGKKPIGWSDILALARSQKGWEALRLSAVGKLQVWPHPSPVQQQRADFTVG